VPADVIRTFRAFLDFCYLVRRDMFNETTLGLVQDALERFHHFRKIFQTLGVRPTGFSLPRQHSLSHYRQLIRMFGAPNGLCSSITESKHIKAVKEPWRRSNRCNALGQMLAINQRLDKLAAAQTDFTSRDMLKGTVLVDACERAGIFGKFICYLTDSLMNLEVQTCRATRRLLTQGCPLPMQTMEATTRRMVGMVPGAPTMMRWTKHIQLMTRMSSAMCFCP
jgi:hypothetical protein